MDEGLDRAQASDVLAATLPDSEGNGVGSLGLDEVDVHVGVPHVFLECPARPSHCDDARLDLDRNILRHGQLFRLEDVAHLHNGQPSVSAPRNPIRPPSTPPIFNPATTNSTTKRK